MELKSIIKYFLGQLLFLYKSLFLPQSINKEYIKVIFFSREEQLKSFDKLVEIGFSNILHLVNTNSFQPTNSNNRVIFSLFKTYPQSNAQIHILEKKTLNLFFSSGVNSDYVFFSFMSFFKQFKTVLKFLYKKKYFFIAIKRWHKLGFLFERKHKSEYHVPRRFIPHNFNKIELLKELNKKEIEYVVLRKFDKLNNSALDIYEDIDILINSDNIFQIDKLLENTIGIVPFDVYSVKGETIASYAGLPYFPPEFASKILKSKVLHKNDYYRPNNYFYVISYLYHLVFHKSVKSGLPIIFEESEQQGDKKMIKKVNELLKSINKTKYEASLTSLYDFLNDIGYTPEYDLILKLKHLKNDLWYKYLIKIKKEEITKKYNYIKGLGILFLRDRAYSKDNIKRVLEGINEFGFYLLKHAKIEDDYINKTASNIRGGKWDVGDYEINAGLPKHYFIIYDNFCLETKGLIRKNYPNLENKKLLNLKIYLRNNLNENYSKSMNSIHSSDDFFESIFYLETIFENKKEVVSIIEKAKHIDDSFDNQFEIIKDLSTTMMKSKVELIKYKNGLAVKKTYKKERLDYLNREVWFLEKFKNSSFVPKLFEIKDNYFIIEYLSDSYDLKQKKHISIENIKQLKSFFKEIFKENITILDANPANILIDKNKKLRVLDFEYAQVYNDKPSSVVDIYELGKIPLNKVKVYPKGHESIEDAYNVFWKDKLYLTKKQFFYIDNNLLLFLLRSVNKHYFNFLATYSKLLKYSKLALKKSSKV